MKVIFFGQKKSLLFTKWRLLIIYDLAQRLFHSPSDFSNCKKNCFLLATTYRSKTGKFDCQLEMFFQWIDDTINTDLANKFVVLFFPGEEKVDREASVHAPSRSPRLISVSGLTVAYFYWEDFYKMASPAACIPSPPLQQQQQQQQPLSDQETPVVDVPRLPIESGDEANLTLSMTTEDDDPDTLDLSSQELTKLTRAAPECTLNTMTLILDNNSLQRLDNIHTYQCIEKVRTSQRFYFENVLDRLWYFKTYSLKYVYYN